MRAKDILKTNDSNEEEKDEPRHAHGQFDGRDLAGNDSVVGLCRALGFNSYARTDREANPYACTHGDTRSNGDAGSNSDSGSCYKRPDANGRPHIAI